MHGSTCSSHDCSGKTPSSVWKLLITLRRILREWPDGPTSNNSQSAHVPSLVSPPPANAYLLSSSNNLLVYGRPMSRNDASGLRKVSKTCENCSSVLRLAMLSEWTILYSVWCLCYVWRLMYYVTACRPTLFNIIIIPNKYMYVCNFRQKVSTVTSVRRTSAGIYTITCRIVFISEPSFLFQSRY